MSKENLKKLTSEVTSEILQGLNAGAKVQIEYNNKTEQVHLAVIKIQRFDVNKCK